MNENNTNKPLDKGDKTLIFITCLILGFIIWVKVFPESLFSPRFIHSSVNWGVLILGLTVIGGIIRFIVYLFKRTRYKISEASIRSEEQSLEYYTVAEQEITDNTYDKGLWSKALVEAKGNEDLRKVEYMKLRVKQLQRNK